VIWHFQQLFLIPNRRNVFVSGDCRMNQSVFNNNSVVLRYCCIVLIIVYSGMDLVKKRTHDVSRI